MAYFLLITLEYRMKFIIVNTDDYFGFDSGSNVEPVQIKNFPLFYVKKYIIK